MSDLAGPRQSSGFDAYLTGFPIPTMNSYAIARTWLAPEMPRPGCVWTHTVLIPFRELPNVDVLDLSQLHRRPEFPPDLTYYRDAIALRTNLSRNWATVGKPDAAILQTLYEHPQQAVWVASLNSAEYEPQTLAMWAQGWPDLKKRLSFSTGSLSPRLLGGRLLDLNIIPESQIPAWLEVKGGREARPGKGVAKWASRAAVDLSHPGEFHKFMQSVGAGGREMFAPLARLFVATELETGFSETTRMLEEAAALPIPNARKQRLLAHQVRRESRLSSEAILDFLLHSASFPQVAKSAAISERAENIVMHRSDAGWRLARKAVLDTSNAMIRGRLLNALAESTTSAQLLAKDDSDWAVVLELLRRRPILAAAPNLWRTSRETQADVLEAISAGMLDEQVRCQILREIVLSGSDDAFQAAESTWRESLTLAVLDAVQTSSDPGYLSPSAEGLVAHDLTQVKVWLHSHPDPSDAVLSLLARTVEPSNLLGEVAGEQWTRLTEHGTALNDARTLAFLLHVGLRGRDHHAMNLVLYTFPRMHRLAARNEISNTAWRVVEPLMPKLGILRDWDKCERLRRAVARSWVREHWPTEPLLLAAGTQELRRLLTRTLSDASSVNGPVRPAEHPRGRGRS
jgi:hypothetical protein